MNNSLQFDNFAPIIPAQGLAGLILRTHIKDMYDLLHDLAYSNDGIYALDEPFYVRYELKHTVSAVFHILNGKLMKLGALEKYEGELFNNIKVGMNIRELLVKEPRIYYDEFEELLLIRGVPGIALETDTPEVNPIDNQEQTIRAITVYVPELDDFSEEIARGNW